MNDERGTSSAMPREPVIPRDELRGEQVLLRSAQAQDAQPLADILEEPGVRRWWLDYDMDRVERELVQGTDDGTVVYVIEIDGAVAGIIQFYEENEHHFRHASIDLFLGTKWQGRGYGPEAIRLVARMLLEERNHHRLVIDPAAANTHAIAAYTRVGFRPVGIMRQYTKSPTGEWEDGLLMDLLRGELR